MCKSFVPKTNKARTTSCPTHCLADCPMTTNPPAPAGDGRASLLAPPPNPAGRRLPGFACDETARALVLLGHQKCGGAAPAEDRQLNPGARESADSPPLPPAPNENRDPLPHTRRDHADCDPSQRLLLAWCSAVVPQSGKQPARQSPAPARSATRPGSPNLPAG